MNCRRRGPAGKSREVNVDPSKAGNGVQKKGDKHGMEYRPVKKNPEWEGKGRKAEWK